MSVTNINEFRAKKDSERLADLVMEDARLEALREAEEAWKSQLAMSAKEMEEHAQRRSKTASRAYSKQEWEVLAPHFNRILGVHHESTS